MADLQVFDVRFGFSMSKSPRGHVFSRFRWIGAGFIRVQMFKNCFFNPFMGLRNVQIRNKTPDFLGFPCVFLHVHCFFQVCPGFRIEFRRES